LSYAKLRCYYAAFEIRLNIPQLKKVSEKEDNGDDEEGGSTP